MKTTIWTIVLAAALAAVLAPAPGIAQETARQSEFTKACAVDIKLQCAGVRAGEGRIRACVREHMKDLSEPCRALLVRSAVTAKACAPDVKTHCADVKRGDGRIIECLKAHLDEVSASCKDALTRAADDKS
jgi:Cysteine rich repeat